MLSKWQLVLIDKKLFTKLIGRHKLNLCKLPLNCGLLGKKGHIKNEKFRAVKGMNDILPDEAAQWERWKPFCAAG